MPVDALAVRLQQLLEEGSVVSSAITRSMRRRIESLFWAGALVETKSGGGKRVEVVDREALLRWVNTTYPSGLDGHEGELPPRANAVADFRDSKAGRRLAGRPVFMRGFGHAALHREGDRLPLAALTDAHQLVGVLVEEDAPWAVTGTLALVENFELFMHVECVVPEVDAALWTAGRLDQRLLEWVAGMPDVTVLHLGDYDPVGLDEFRRVEAAMPGRARLFVPEDFEERLVRFGTGELLVRSMAVLERVRAQASPEIRTVLKVMDRHGKALEQEGLLVPLSQIGSFDAADSST